MDKEIISIDSIDNSFSEFIKIDGNKRIFFSGGFGTGKTFFLRKYFKKHSDDYEVFHLYPVNYQISKNEDIVELFKYDILVELFNKNKDIFLEGDGASSFKIFLSFLKERGSLNGFLDYFINSVSDITNLTSDPVLMSFGKLGRPLQDLLKIDKEFQRYKKEVTSKDKNVVEDFIKEIASKDIQSTDYLSYLLKEKIKGIKGDKKSVLVLDDIDRIDPEHLFRILNIFSAHFDDEENKFGFDHIVIVGDINNLKSIFTHRYGENTDFWGYFDKFFTIRPYHLDNENIIKESLPSLIKQIRCSENLKDAVGESGIIKSLLTEILSNALDLKQINLRQIYSPINYSFPESSDDSYQKDPFVDGRNRTIDIGIKLLISIYAGDKDRLLSLLEKIKGNNLEKEKSNWFYRMYSASMIRHLINLDTDEKTRWLNKYPLIAQSDSGNNRFVISLEQGHENLYGAFFYDVLIEYVKQRKYIKTNNWDYDR